MTETEQQPTDQPEKTQSFHHHAEEEISLVDLLEVLLRKKVLILAITSVCALISVIYAQSISPTYEATISFLEPQETFLSVLPTKIAMGLPGWEYNTQNQESKIAIEKPSAFRMFLSKVMSYNLKREAFKNGHFLKKFYGDSHSLDLNNIVMGIHNSISITKEKKDESLPSFERPVYLKMVGPKPEAMAEFLTMLAESAKQITIKDIKDRIRLIVNEEIVKINLEMDGLRLSSRVKQEQDLLHFSEALTIAKNLGIKNNNFHKLNNDKFSVRSLVRSLNDISAGALSATQSAQVEIQDNSLPIWFLYGEEALKQEIMQKTQKSEHLILGLVEKESELKLYKSIDPSLLKVEVAIIAQPSIPPTKPIKPNKLLIIAMGIALGLFIGLVMAFLSNLMDQLEKKQIRSTSTSE